MMGHDDANKLAAAAATGDDEMSAATLAASNREYLEELRQLQHRIMTLEDNSELQEVVEIIASTGCYEVTSKTFDFDLCALDRGTVQRLQEYFATCASAAAMAVTTAETSATETAMMS